MKTNEEMLLDAAEKLVKEWDTLPFCKNKVGDHACLSVQRWKSFNYTEIEVLRQTVEACILGGMSKEKTS